MVQRTILFYINQIYDGGAERVIVTLANLFAEDGCRSILLTSFRHSGEYDLSEKVHRISVEGEEKKDGRLRKNFRRITFLRKAVLEYHPDIVVSFMSESIVRALVGTIGLDVKNLISVRANPEVEYKSGIRRFLSRTLYSMTDACVFQTNEAKGWFPRRLQKKSRIIFNPINESFYQVERRPVKGKIVTCGRLSPEKNHKILIGAFYEVQKEFHEVSLEIYGEGVLREELQLYIDSLGISDKVFLRGKTSNVAEVLSQAELFVLSSDTEGLPNALQEALAAGVPCISTDCPSGGPAMLIDDGYNGKLCRPKDTKGLAGCMLELLADKQRREAMGEAARKKARAFASDKVFEDWREYISEVING